MRTFGHTYAVKQICPAPVRIVSRLGIWWANEGSFASVHLPLVDADQTDVAVATTGGRTTSIHLEHLSKPPSDSSRNVVLTSQREIEMAKRLRAVRSGDRYGTG